MKLIAVLFLLSAGLQAQTITQALIWTIPPVGRPYYQWVNLGPTLVVSGGKLDAIIPPGTIPKVRVYSTILTLSGGNYPLPTGATNVACWLNGIRQAPGVDYQILSGVIAPLTPWPAPPNIVLVDYDAP
jgi:hypothetical protein